MLLKCEVVKEDSRLSGDGKTEYLSCTVTEIGADKTLLQHLEYSLDQSERELKGKLLGKRVEIKVVDIQDGFHGRPRIYGSLRMVAGGSAVGK